MDCFSPRAAVWKEKCFGLVAVCFPPYWIKRITWYIARFLSKKYRKTVDPSTYLLCNRWLLVLVWWMQKTLTKIRRHVIDFIDNDKTDFATDHVAIFVTSIMTLAWRLNNERPSLLPSLRVYITWFKVVLHLRPNVITFRTMIKVTLKWHYI